MMSSGKPPLPVKPTGFHLDLKSPTAVASPRPSVSELKKNIEGKLRFPDPSKKKVAQSLSAGEPPRSTTVLPHHCVPSRSVSIHHGQGREDTVSPGNGIKVNHRCSNNRGTCIVTPQSQTPDLSGSVPDVSKTDAIWKNERQIVKTRDKDSQNLEVKRTNDQLEEINGELLLCDPVSMLMEQIKDSVEMPVVHINALLEEKLVQLLICYEDDIDKARIHCISSWNDMVNQLLNSTGYSSSDFYRNIASLILCEVDLDMKVASKYLGNDRVKMAITRHVSRLEQRGQLENSTLSRHEDNEGVTLSLDFWNDIVEEVMGFWWETAAEQKCQICWETSLSDKIFGLSFCQCIVCNACMQRYFIVMIHDGYVANFICPVCHLPDVEDVDKATLHFQLLEPKLKTLLSADDFRAYQRKMTEWNLMRNPNFLWCINTTCHSGFVIEENGYSRVTCPDCRLEMCHKCRKPWEEQHVGLTCERFKAWKESNDPEFQEAALKQQLQENGIDCPRCKRRYLLSKGGCIHFTCTFCLYEFCSSCSRPFDRTCKKSNHCKQSGGLHCHHPRNCLYYLRDRSVVELQTLLKNNNVSYVMSFQTDITTCQVLEEQDTDTGFTREHICNAKSFLPGHAGFCEKHYKEYLSGIIQRNRIDPAAVMSLSELNRELENSGVTSIPKQLSMETENEYHSRLRQLVMVHTVLPRGDLH